MKTPREILDGIWKRRDEWESFSNPPMRLTEQDKQGIRELLNRAVELSGKTNDRNNPLLKGLFVHLHGMRKRSCFPMGIKAWGMGLMKTSSRVPFLLNLVSQSYFLEEESMLYKFGMVTAEQAEEALKNEKIRSFTCNNNLFPRLSELMESINKWEDKMSQLGFYVLPTGLESLLPVGEGALVNVWNNTDRISLFYIHPDGIGQKHQGNDIRELMREIVEQDVPNVLEFYMGLPQKFKSMLAGI